MCCLSLVYIECHENQLNHISWNQRENHEKNEDTQIIIVCGINSIMLQLFLWLCVTNDFADLDKHVFHFV